MGIFYKLPDDPDALEMSTFIRILDSDIQFSLFYIYYMVIPAYLTYMQSTS